MDFVPDLTRQTREAFDDPRPGDRFQEMYTFWLYVVDVGESSVTTMQCAAPCTFPDDAKVVVHATREEFRQEWKYGGTSSVADHYTVYLADRDNNVSGWVERKRAIDAKAAEATP